MQPRQTVQFAALTALSMMGLLALWCSRPADLDSLAALSPPPSPLAASASIASGDGHAVAVTPPNERVEQPILPTLELTIVGSGDGRPLPDAAVDWQCTNSTARGQVTSNRDGATFLCPAPTGPCHLTVRCAGYVTLQAILPPVDAKACVALERGGDLTVTVRDGDGNPAPGVAIALLPPRLLGSQFDADFVAFATAVPKDDGDRAQSWPELIRVDGVFRLPAEPAPADRSWHVDARWHGMKRRQVTGADGVAAWSGLPAADGYRFGFLPPTHGDTEPPHERQRLTVGSTGVTVEAAPPSNLSGQFRIAVEQPAAVTGRILRNGTLRGRFVAPAGMRLPARLFGITQAGGGDIVGVTALHVAGMQTTDADGRFVFEHVRPGDYALRTCWLEHGRDVYFASVTVRVPPGATVDIGDVVPTQGSSVTVEVGLEDGEGIAQAPEAVFAAGKNTAVLLQFEVVPENETLADSLSELSMVQIGVPMVFHGLPPGRVHLTAMPTGNTPTVANVVRLAAGATQQHQLPQSDVLRPRLRVDVGHSMAIELRGEDGSPRVMTNLLARNRASGRSESYELQASEDDSRTQLRLQRGDYECFFAVRIGASAECAVANLTAPRNSDAPLAVTLRPAARVRGRLLDAAGKAVPQRSLRWTLPGWDGDSGTWLFVATTDREGQFEVDGIPVEHATRPAPDTPALPTLGAGEHSLVLVLPHSH